MISSYLIRIKRILVIPFLTISQKAKQVNHVPSDHEKIDRRQTKEKGENVETYLAFNKLRYNVQAIPQVLWKGTLYWIGMSLKLIPWMMGQIFQLARMAER